MITYCILGGGGSFGLHVADYLLRQESTRRVLSIGRAPPKHKAFLLGVGDGDARYEYRQFHVTYDIYDLLRILDFTAPDVIINFAAQGEGATSFTESWRYFETNCVGLSRLVENIRARSYLKRFVHIGSSEVYGATDQPAHEESPLRPTSPYAISKAAFDQYLLAVRRKFNFPVVIMRPSNAYGEGQQLHRVIPKAFLFGMTGRKLPLHDGGRAQKSYIHSEDLARAIHLAAHAPDIGPIYNVGPERPTSIRQVCEFVSQSLGFNSVDQLVEIAPERGHQDSRYWLSSKRAAQELGWHPIIAWQDGLERVRKWCADNLDTLRNMPTEFVMRP